MTAHTFGRERTKSSFQISQSSLQINKDFVFKYSQSLPIYLTHRKLEEEEEKHKGLSLDPQRNQHYHRFYHHLQHSPLQNSRHVGQEAEEEEQEAEEEEEEQNRQSAKQQHHIQLDAHQLYLLSAQAQPDHSQSFCYGRLEEETTQSSQPQVQPPKKRSYIPSSASLAFADQTAESKKIGRHSALDYTTQSIHAKSSHHHHHLLIFIFFFSGSPLLLFLLLLPYSFFIIISYLGGTRK